MIKLVLISPQILNSHLVSQSMLHHILVDIALIIKTLGERLTGPTLKVATEDESLISDALAIYKDPKYDATRPLRITFLN